LTAGSIIASSADAVVAWLRVPVSRHMLFRANRSTCAVQPASASDCGCSMLALANTSARSPALMRSRSNPDAPNVSRALLPESRSYACARSASGARRLPAANTENSAPAATIATPLSSTLATT